MRLRLIELTRAAFGVALLVVPRRVLEDLHRVRADRASTVVARVLGARQLAQAALSGVNPSPEVLATGVWVDLAHGATAVGLAVADPSRASAGLLNAAASSLWAGWGYADLRRGPVPPPDHDRRRDAFGRWTLEHLPWGGRLARTARDRRSGPKASP